MKKFLCCFKPNKVLDDVIDIRSIQLDEIREQQKQILELISKERFQEELIKYINDDISSAINKHSIFIKKKLEATIENDLKKMEYAIISNITQSIHSNIENNLTSSLDKYYKNILHLNKKFTNDFNLELNKITSNLQNDIKLLIENKKLEFINSNQPIHSNQTNDPIENDTLLLEEVEIWDGKNNISSSERYLKKYSNTDDTFWGIGLENETYLQGSPIELNGSQIINQLGKERYSVDYTKNYHFDKVKEILKDIFEKDKNYHISRMINGHCFSKMDRNNEHLTTYTKNPKPNTKFNGKTVLDEWFEYDSRIKNALDPIHKDNTNIFFDGDTIEFITENFYKTNSLSIVSELNSRRNWFLSRLNTFLKEKEIWNDLGELRFVEKHPGFNIFRTAPNKIVMFNNSTIHIHLTLPTRIQLGKIVDENEFIEKHKRAMKMIQWFEPFLISTLGSPDIMEFIYEKYNNNQNEIYFSGGSMRATISRYIGLGTYDYNNMPNGKILQKNIDECKPKVTWWRDLIEKNMLYKLPEKEIGLDFNFKKHYQSGLEFRILDGIPMNILKNVLDIILLLCEHSYHVDVPNSTNNQVWNLLIYISCSRGYRGAIQKNQALEICRIMKIKMEVEVDDIMSIEDFYYKLLENIFELYKNKETKVIQYMCKNFTKINRWENFNKIQCDEHINSLKNI